LTDTNFAVGAAIQPLPVSPFQIDGQVIGGARVKGLQIDNNTGQHETLKLTVVMAVLDSSTLVNKPFYMRYGLSPNYSYFYGYTTNVSKPQSPGVASQIEISASGFSSIMKLSPSRVFVNRTTEQIMREVLAGTEEYRYQIGLSAQPHDFVHQRLAQVGETDWEFINRLAKMAGFWIYPYSGVVVMSQPLKTLETGSVSRTLEKSTQTLDLRPLLEFVPTMRTDQTRQDFEPDITYFTPTATQTFTTNLPPHRRMKIPDYVYSQAHAQFIADGMKVMTGMYQNAKARIRGDAGIKPGMLVDIHTGLTRGAADSFDGIWYVGGVSHFIDEKVFQTALVLCRDKTRWTSGTDQNFYNNEPYQFPTMRLVNGAWQSSWSN
jgi:hypothetical protein